jgi:2-dehydro-3-deoxygluconokinase
MAEHAVELSRLTPLSRPTPLVVTLGEIMLRLRAPGRERLFQSPVLEATFGGGEANVAVSLAQLGVAARFVTALPPGPLGDAAIAQLRGFGVDVSVILRRPGRMGLYFLEPGAAQRASLVTYDRDGSAMALVDRGELDWDAVLEGATWFHITGITPALSASAASVADAAMTEARARGIACSIDLNHRASLWRYGRSAQEVMRELVARADLVVANEEDCQRSLGIEARADVRAGRLSADAYEELSAEVLRQFPNLRAVAITLRESRGADVNGWSACLRDADGFHEGRSFEILDIVDRVGTGDAFAAGLIYGYVRELPLTEALDLAIAAGCLKHSVPGDLNRVTLDEVLRLVSGDASGRVSR